MSLTLIVHLALEPECGGEYHVDCAGIEEEVRFNVEAAVVIWIM